MCMSRTLSILRPKVEGKWDAEPCAGAHHAQRLHAAGNMENLDDVTCPVGAARLHHVHISAVV